MDPIDQWLAAAQGHLDRTGRPLVSLSYAESLDGCISARRGEQLQLSGQEASMYTHQLRARHEAILVGVGTILTDDPRLTVRLVAGPDPQPVVLDSRLRFPEDARMLNNPKKPWIATTRLAPSARRHVLEAAGVQIWELERNSQGLVSLPDLLDRLGGCGIASLMVEGGARVITHFLEERLVDLVFLTIASCFIGGLPAVERRRRSKQLPELRETGCRQAGKDILVWGKPVWEQT